MCDYQVILSDNLNERVRITPLFLNLILPNRNGHQLFDKKGKKL